MMQRTTLYGGLLLLVAAASGLLLVHRRHAAPPPKILANQAESTVSSKPPQQQTSRSTIITVKSIGPLDDSVRNPALAPDYFHNDQIITFEHVAFANGSFFVSGTDPPFDHVVLWCDGKAMNMTIKRVDSLPACDVDYRTRALLFAIFIPKNFAEIIFQTMEPLMRVLFALGIDQFPICNSAPDAKSNNQGARSNLSLILVGSKAEYTASVFNLPFELLASMLDVHSLVCLDDLVLPASFMLSRPSTKATRTTSAPLPESILTSQTVCFRHLTVLSQDVHYIYRYPVDMPNTTTYAYRDTTPKPYAKLWKTLANTIQSHFEKASTSTTPSTTTSLARTTTAYVSTRASLASSAVLQNQHKTHMDEKTDPVRAAESTKVATTSTSNDSLLLETAPRWFNVTLIARKTDTVTHYGSQRVFARAILNMPEVLSVIQQFPSLQVHVVEMDALSLMKQIEIVRQSAVLIAVHGAGGMHAIFLPENGIFLQLSPYMVEHDLYPRVALATGHRAFNYQVPTIRDIVIYSHAFPESCLDAINAARLAAKLPAFTPTLKFATAANNMTGVDGVTFLEIDREILEHKHECGLNSFYWKQQDIRIDPHLFTTTIQAVVAELQKTNR